MFTAYLIGSMLAAGMGSCYICKRIDENYSIKTDGIRLKFVLIIMAGTLSALFSWFTVGVIIVDEFNKSRRS